MFILLSEAKREIKPRQREAASSFVYRKCGPHFEKHWH